MIIGHNLMANSAIKNTNANATQAGRSMEKLSSGLKITTAADDAAGLAISEKMKAQIRGLDQATTNAQDGVSLLQTADGALTETTSILQRMRELANQAANDTNTTTDRTAIQTEADELAKQLDNIADTTTFNTKNLLDGTIATAGLSLQIGANSGEAITITIGNMGADSAGLSVQGSAAGTALSMSSASAAGTALDAIDEALKKVATQRAQLGAYQNRLESTINNLSTTSQNLTSAQSSVADVDMATEMSEYSKNNILSQAAQAMLAQANQQPQQVLQLLK